jgi:type I restriction enzyme R subunit
VAGADQGDPQPGSNPCKANKPRALIQMATGSGKTFTAISVHLPADQVRRRAARAVSGGPGQPGPTRPRRNSTSTDSPYNNFKFGEEYIVQHLQSNQLDTTARVTICTIQRLFSMLKGRETGPEDDEQSVDRLLRQLFARAEPIEYNPAIPIETFDIIVTDECPPQHLQPVAPGAGVLRRLPHRPDRHAQQADLRLLQPEPGHGIRPPPGRGRRRERQLRRLPHPHPAISEQGSQVEAGYSVGYRDRLTRKTRWEQLDEDMAYDADALDRAVQTPDQIRTIVRTFRDKLHTDIFPGRTEVPKTLVFAKDDNHAEKIVEILREEFGKGNDFAQKITYRTTGEKPERLISAFRNSYFPRIAVTVDMIATGTDIKPVEMVMFMRAVKSRNFFEQMKGRGVRIIKPTDLQAVTPDAKRQGPLRHRRLRGRVRAGQDRLAPMDAKKSVPFDKLLQAVALGNVEPEVLSSVAARLARLDRELTEPNQRIPIITGGGHSLKDLARGIVDALNPDTSADLPPGEAEQLMQRATKPLCDPALRQLLAPSSRRPSRSSTPSRKTNCSQADFSEAARERAKGTVESFERFIAEHKDEITALQILYSRPQRLQGAGQGTEPLTFEALKALADTLQARRTCGPKASSGRPTPRWTRARSKAKGGRRILTDLVSLVRFAMHQDNELLPFPERVNANFKAWLGASRRRLEGWHPFHRNNCTG